MQVHTHFLLRFQIFNNANSLCNQILSFKKVIESGKKLHIYVLNTYLLQKAITPLRLSHTHNFIIA